MFAKTMIALLAVLVLNVAHVSAQAQTDRALTNGGRGCVSMEEGARSAFPAWRVC